MPALDFPASPTNGQVYGNWIYSSSKGAWQAKPLTSAVATPSDTAPLNPDNGDLWYNTTDGSTYVYYTDGTSNQWVQIKADTSFTSTLGPNVDALMLQSPNYIINGAFDFWQRGTTFSASGYTADRWTGDFVTGAGTISQQAFAPGTAPIANIEGTFFLRRNVTTGAQFSSLIHRIEDVRTLEGQTATLSFWAKGTNPTGNFNVNLLQNFGTGGSTQVGVGDQALVLTSSWTRYSYTFNIPNIAGKTVGAGSHLWLSIYQAAANTSASTLDIWGVQLEAGAKATGFRRAAGTLQGELAACQRYFISMNSVNSALRFYGMGANYQPTLGVATIALPVRMRAVPTLTLSAANTFQLLTSGSNLTLSAATASANNQGEEMVAIDYTLGVSISNAAAGSFRSNNVTTSWINASAEL